MANYIEHSALRGVIVPRLLPVLTATLSPLTIVTTVVDDREKRP